MLNKGLFLSSDLMGRRLIFTIYNRPSLTQDLPLPPSAVQCRPYIPGQNLVVPMDIVECVDHFDRDVHLLLEQGDQSGYSA